MKFLFITYLLISFLFPQDSDISIESLSAKATAYYFNSEYDLANEYSQKILKLNPYNPEANFYTAEYYAFSGDFKKAVEFFNIAIDNEPDFILAYYQRAIARMIANQNLTFCSDLEMVIELVNKFPEFEYLKEERAPELYDVCELYIKGAEVENFYDNPKEYLVEIGQYLTEIGSCGFATLFFNQAITDNPLNDYAYTSKSSCIEGEKKAELLYKAISINPNNDIAYSYLGMYYIEEDESQKGIKYLKKSAKLGNEAVIEWFEHSDTKEWLETLNFNWE